MTPNKKEHGDEQHHDSGYGIYIVVWLALLVLTAITVTVGGMDLGKLSVMTALAIAAVKATLVLGYFMHLKYERPYLKVMFLVVVITLTVFIGLTFFDPLYR